MSVFLPLLIVGLALAGLGFYVYKDLHKSSVTPSSPVASKDSLTIDPANSGSGYIVKMLDDKPAAVTQKPLPLPNLNLPVGNNAHLDTAFFNAAASNIRDLSAALKKNPDNEELWLRLGIQRKMLGDYQVVAGILNYVILEWPADYVPYTNLADVYQFYLKNYPLAEKNLLKVIALKPDNPQTYENLYNLYTGPYTEKKANALGTLLQGLTNNPTSIDLMVYIARYYKGVGDMASAATYYQKAISEAKSEHNGNLELSLKIEAAQ